MEFNRVLILDFGSQVTLLIARRLREIGFYSEVHRFDLSLSDVKKFKPSAIILSGGPSSVFEDGAPHCDVKLLLDIAPVLGICYGMQLLAHQLGGVVESAQDREYGLNQITWQTLPQTTLIPFQKQKVWMSHGDVVNKVPPDAVVAAYSQTQHIAAMMSERYWAFQFHPEVSHTESGTDLLKAFLIAHCGLKPNWQGLQVLNNLKAQILQTVKPHEKVLCALSGGVDSTVLATLLTEVLGRERVLCLFLNNGLLRFNEFENVLSDLSNRGLNICGIDATKEFLTALAGLTDPEQKRKAIGRVFIEVFEKQVQNLGFAPDYLAQGTLYPDVIESFSFKGPSATIKSHHNVGGLPERLKFKLLEPLRELFKDEVRIVGRELGMPAALIGRHPFPGPGLAIRVLGEVTESALQIVRQADHIFISELKDAKLYDKVWQAFCVLLPVKSVGVQGDGRTYENTLALRAVESTDGMTADWVSFDAQFLRRVSNRITNEVRGVNRVVYDISSKPPATIEWE